MWSNFKFAIWKMWRNLKISPCMPRVWLCDKLNLCEILCGEKYDKKLCVWRKNDKYQVCLLTLHICTIHPSNQVRHWWSPPCSWSSISVQPTGAHAQSIIRMESLWQGKVAVIYNKCNVPVPSSGPRLVKSSDFVTPFLKDVNVHSQIHLFGTATLISENLIFNITKCW